MPCDIKLPRAAKAAKTLADGLPVGLSRVGLPRRGEGDKAAEDALPATRELLRAQRRPVRARGLPERLQQPGGVRIRRRQVGGLALIRVQDRGLLHQGAAGGGDRGVLHRGIRATGVDTLAERAGVSKPTLYAQFGSKEQLVAAVLRRRSEGRQAGLRAFLDAQDGAPAGRLLSVFDWLASGHQRDGFRGCAFTNAAVELPDPDHPARLVITDYKLGLRDLLTGLVAEAGLQEPEQVGSELLMLIDGANARVVVTGDRSAMLQARQAAHKVIVASSHTATQVRRQPKNDHAYHRARQHRACRGGVS